MLKRMAAHPKAATAQYRIGLCNERLGNAEAAKAAYEKTVKNFADRPEAAAAKRNLGQ
ncbi:MAG: tetratricopeptide repeat protein [Armatimonadetes bacterium]|nr:tetratricopeptide repeat protein [Armatimonadota bacterium]